VANEYPRPGRAQDNKSGNKYGATGLSPLPGLETVSYHVPGGYYHRLISAAPPAQRTTISRSTDGTERGALSFFLAIIKNDIDDSSYLNCRRHINTR